MKILVAGGAGYIGSTVTAHLLKHGFEVVVYDNLSSGRREVVPEAAVFVRGDIGNEGDLSRLFQENFDVLIHLAANIKPEESMRYPDKYFDNNVKNTQVLVSKAIASGMKRIIFSSTAAVYAANNKLVDEEDRLEPLSVYAETKLIGERILRWYHQIYGVSVCVLRYFNVTGASLLDGKIVRGEPRTEGTHLIPNIFKAALKVDENFIVHGNDYPTNDGTCVRDYIHVDDLAKAHVLAIKYIKSNKDSFQIFNLGSGKGFSVIEMLKKAEEVAGLSIPYAVGPRRSGDAASFAAAIGKAKRLLGWMPGDDSLLRILESAWKWYKAENY